MGWFVSLFYSYKKRKSLGRTENSYGLFCLRGGGYLARPARVGGVLEV